MAKVLPEAKEALGYFPCETKRCPHTHGNWSGYCPECTRKSWLLPPGSLKRLKIAGRKARLLFITLVMTRTVNGTGHTGPSEFCATMVHPAAPYISRKRGPAALLGLLFG